MTPMARTLRLIAALLAAAALLPAAAQAGGLATTRAKIAAQMASAGRGSGAYAIDLDTGRQIYGERAGARARVAHLRGQGGAGARGPGGARGGRRERGHDEQRGDEVQHPSHRRVEGRQPGGRSEVAVRTRPCVPPPATR